MTELWIYNSKCEVVGYIVDHTFIPQEEYHEIKRRGHFILREPFPSTPKKIIDSIRTEWGNKNGKGNN